MDADVLGHSISPAGVSERGKSIRTDQNAHAGRSEAGPRVAGGVACYRKFLRDLSQRIRPIISLPRKGIKLEFTPAMEVIVREILAEVAAPLSLVFLDWDAVTDGSRPFHVYCNAYIYGFGAALEQKQTDGSVRPIAYISYPRFREVLDFVRRGSWQHCLGHQTPSKLPLRYEVTYLFGPQGTRKHRQCWRSQCVSAGWLEFLNTFDDTLQYRKGNANGNADFLSRLPEPTTKHDRSGSSSLTPADDGRIFLIPACELRTRFSPTPAVGSVGLVPGPESSVLGGLYFSSLDFCDFRAQGPYQD